jgi:hypothetical protein
MPQPDHHPKAWRELKKRREEKRMHLGIVWVFPLAYDIVY